MFHSTILQHMKILQKDLEIPNKILYAILGYNHSIHSSTTIKPIEVINGHHSDSEPFNIDLK